MKYMYPHINTGLNPRLVENINQAAGKVHYKLSKLDLKRTGISEYNQRALQGKLSNPIGHLQLYSYLLCLALAEGSDSLDRFTFIEYGGGAGVLSLLAKASGIGTVIYNDIYDISCKDAQAIASAVGICIDAYVCGDMDDLIDHVAQAGNTVNAIASWDVIEHIYDIENYLKKLKFISNQPFRVVFGSGANAKNPLIRRKLEKKQVTCEYQDRKQQWGHKERDTLESYFNVRKQIIKNYAPELPPATIAKIAKKTRGLMIDDIQTVVEEFKETGGILYQPEGSFNTCDPYTGNWAEHLMDTDKLKTILTRQGFAVKILSGFWPSSNSFYKKIITNVLNIALGTMGSKAMALSPYYVIQADYDR